MNRAGLLDLARQTVCTDRQDAHGDPEDSFGTIANLWSAYLGHVRLSPADVAAMMALLKIARIRGNPRHADSWVDLAGYAACGAEVAQS